MLKEYMISEMIIEREGKEDEEISIEGNVEYSKDTFYGEDANGGRAETRTFVEDVHDVYAWDFIGSDVLLTPKEIEQAKNILTNKFLMG